MTLWIVGKSLSVRYTGAAADFSTEYPTQQIEEPTATEWEFVGVFNSEFLARRSCIDWRYFVAPARLNVAAPEESFAWEGLYFPKLHAAWSEADESTIRQAIANPRNGSMRVALQKLLDERRKEGRRARE